MKRRDFIKVTGIGVAGAATMAAPASRERQGASG